jgi:hypothetical protein
MNDFEHRVITHEELSNNRPSTIPTLRLGKVDAPFSHSPLEQSQVLEDAFVEPRFCLLVPLSKGICCGYISLKKAMLLITLVDITFGGAALGIGITAFLRMHLHFSLISFVILNGACFVLALLSLFAIQGNFLRALRFYFLWKLGEVFLLPIFELIVMRGSEGGMDSNLMQAISVNYYLLVGLKALARLFFAYLIMSYNYRRELGEHLLIDHGERKLKRIIDQI